MFCKNRAYKWKQSIYLYKIQASIRRTFRRWQLNIKKKHSNSSLYAVPRSRSKFKHRYRSSFTANWECARDEYRFEILQFGGTRPPGFNNKPLNSNPLALIGPPFISVISLSRQKNNAAEIIPAFGADGGLLIVQPVCTSLSFDVRRENVRGGLHSINVGNIIYLSELFI